MNFIDEAILDACLKKDRKAQYQLYKHCYSFLTGICFRYVNNREDADELLNMAFLKILNNLGKYRQEIPFTLWIRRIMINTIIDDYRKNKKEKELMRSIDFNEYYPAHDHSTVNDFVKKADAEQITALIFQLPPMTQRVFNLFAIDGFGHKEIGELLGMSEGTSKWHLNSARTKLKEMISKLASNYKIAAS
jgi:RNA polymerase sigma factor (sigma-70 family)